MEKNEVFHISKRVYQLLVLFIIGIIFIIFGYMDMRTILHLVLLISGIILAVISVIFYKMKHLVSPLGWLFLIIFLLIIAGFRTAIDGWRYSYGIFVTIGFILFIVIIIYTILKYRWSSTTFVTTFFVLFLICWWKITSIQLLGTYHAGIILFPFNLLLLLLVALSCVFFLRAFKKENKKRIRRNFIAGIGFLALPLCYFGFFILFYTYQAIFNNFLIGVHQGMGWVVQEPVYEIIYPVIFGWLMFVNLFFLFKHLWKKLKSIDIHIK